MIGTVLMNKFGRKPLLIISLSVCLVTMTGLGAFTFFMDRELRKSSSLQWLSLTCTILFILGQTMGLSPVPWVLVGELLPGMFMVGKKLGNCNIRVFWQFFLPKWKGSWWKEINGPSLIWHMEKTSGGSSQVTQFRIFFFITSSKFPFYCGRSGDIRVLPFDIYSSFHLSFAIPWKCSQQLWHLLALRHHCSLGIDFHPGVCKWNKTHLFLFRRTWWWWSHDDSWQHRLEEVG